jgi:hypothetical protein
MIVPWGCDYDTILTVVFRKIPRLDKDRIIKENRTFYRYYFHFL